MSTRRRWWKPLVKEMGELLEQVSDGLDAVAMAIDKLTAMLEQKMNQLVASVDAKG